MKALAVILASLLLSLGAQAAVNCPPAPVTSPSAQHLGGALIEAREALYQNQSVEQFSLLVALGQDTRYSAFVRGWLYHEAEMNANQLNLAEPHSDAQQRSHLLSTLIRCIDLE